MLPAPSVGRVEWSGRCTATMPPQRFRLQSRQARLWPCILSRHPPGIVHLVTSCSIRKGIPCQENSMMGRRRWQ